MAGPAPVPRTRSGVALKRGVTCTPTEAAARGVRVTMDVFGDLEAEVRRELDALGPLSPARLTPEPSGLTPEPRCGSPRALRCSIGLRAVHVSCCIYVESSDSYGASRQVLFPLKPDPGAGSHLGSRARPWMRRSGPDLLARHCLTLFHPAAGARASPIKARRRWRSFCRIRTPSPTPASRSAGRRAPDHITSR